MKNVTTIKTTTRKIFCSVCPKWEIKRPEKHFEEAGFSKLGPHSINPPKDERSIFKVDL